MEETEERSTSKPEVIGKHRQLLRCCGWCWRHAAAIPQKKEWILSSPSHQSSTDLFPVTLESTGRFEAWECAPAEVCGRMRVTHNSDAVQLLGARVSETSVRAVRANRVPSQIGVPAPDEGGGFRKQKKDALLPPGFGKHLKCFFAT